ncbi:hypothetical protein SDC9_31905 [bioreactor metagenome]|jgi:hypothetical protein|uniref:Uncharacterized protein n=1 Tax=bioreactor metagenome TaxID=1076179 RepID=A0A644V3M6_9ZZZZ|nr:hypothetical protein [Lentimicrobium sp.]MEA5110257.1 hypothetical protein [Lentimicrobium sp.]
MTHSTNLVKKSDTKIDNETGLIVKGHFEANSGLTYIAGLRRAGSLKIVEGVARGIACNFLTSLLVYDQKGNLIYDASITSLTGYSREVSYNMVLEGLMDMLREGAGKERKYFDEEQARIKITELLDASYYEQSYKTVVAWAESIGIEFY